jgi:uncharacterized protein (TIGR00369 family)
VFSGQEIIPKSNYWKIMTNSPRITIEEFEELCAAQLPFVALMDLKVIDIGFGTARILLPTSDNVLRPGGTVAGPAMMGLADAVMYAAILGQIGRVEQAVTTNLNCNFLRRPKPTDIIGEGKLLKVGRRLAVGEVSMFTVGEEDAPVAHVTATYAIPPDHL